MRFFSIEGNGQMLDGGAMFGNAPKAMWEKWINPDENNRIPLACRSLLVKTEEGKNILFEAGTGTFFEPKLRQRYGIQGEEHLLLEGLGRLGLDPESIDWVVLSHLHFDHAGGILTPFELGETRLLFPNAKFLVSHTQWNRAVDPHARDRASYIPVMQQLLKDSGRLVLTSDSEFKIGNLNVTLRYSSGHSPGMMLAQLDTSVGPLVFGADLVPGIPWIHLPITMGYDRYAELVIEEKKELLNYLSEVGGMIFLTHDNSCSTAKIVRTDEGKFIGLPVGLESLN